MKYGKECVCGRGGECQGVSAAFALLKDPRRGYVQLPQFHANPRIYAETDMNAMRAAYLRHLRRTEESLIRQQQASGNVSATRWFVALHHFHPTVVQKHSEMPGALSPIPKTLKKVDLKFLGVTNMGDEDRVRDEEGRKRKIYYFCPNWPMDMAKADLKRLIRVSRLVSEASQTATKATPSPKSKDTAALLSPLMSSPTIPSSNSSLSPKIEETMVNTATVAVERTPKKEAIKPTATVGAATVVATAAIIATSTAATNGVAATKVSNAVETPAAEPTIVDREAGKHVAAIAAATTVVAAGAKAMVLIYKKEEEKPASAEDKRKAREAEPTVKGTNVTSSETTATASPVTTMSSAAADEGNVLAVAFTAATNAVVAGGLTVISEFSKEDEEKREKPGDSPTPQLDSAKAGEAKRDEESPRSAESDIVKVEETLSCKFFEQEYDEEKLPKNMTMESEEGRKFLFRRMCNFEAKRQATSGDFVDLFVARWRASLEVMQAGIFEMARAERIIRGAALANKAYAEAMQAMYDDVYLDSDLNTVVDPRKQKRIAKEREGLEYTVDAAATPEKSRGEAHTRSAMLGSMVDSQAVIAEKFSDNSESVLEQVVTDLANIRAYLKQQMIDFKKRGDPFILDIQESETEIRTAFAVVEILGSCPGDSTGQSPSFHSKKGFFRGGVSPMQAVGSFHGSFHNSTPLSPSSLHGTPDSPTASKQRSGFFRRSRHGIPRAGSAHGNSDHGQSNHGSNHGGSSHGTGGASPHSDEQLLALDPKLLGNLNSPFVAALRSNVIVRDGWLIEMMYRQAVNCQVQILQKWSEPLEAIWQSMQNIEVNRQVRLHEVLLDFIPRQRRLFLGLSPIAGPILNDLIETRVEPEELEEQIEETIRKRMQVLLKSTNAQRSAIMNRSRATAPNLEELHGMLTGEFFDNGLLKAAKIVERRIGMRGHWQTTLVVATSDRYMHMFDLSAFPQAYLGGAPEPIFELLLPDYDLPSLDSDSVERREDDLLKNLTPVDTVYLVKCSSTVLGEDPRTLDFVESGLSGLIRSTRKFTLRTTGREETKQLVDFMQSCRDDEPSATMSKPLPAKIAESSETENKVAALEA